MAIEPSINQNYAVQITSPVGSTVTVGTVSVAAIGANPRRRGIVFVNPNTSVTLYVCPNNQTAVIGEGIPVFPGGMVQLVGDGKLINYNCGWNAIAASGAANKLTVLELL
jgi:hypothetical protein